MTIRKLGLGKWARMAAVAVGSLAVLASAGSQKSSRPPAAGGTYGAPAPRAMNYGVSHGLWQSSFGPVKIEQDPRYGQDNVQGAWRYERGGQEVIGLFAGRLNGNVLQFNWQEPGQPRPLQGSGYLVFNPDGSRFDGKWWTANRDRSGDWNGWRNQAGGGQGQAPAAGYDPAPPYGGQGYGGNAYGAPAPAPYQETAPGPPPDPPYNPGTRDYL